MKVSATIIGTLMMSLTVFAHAEDSQAGMSRAQKLRQAYKDWDNQPQDFSQTRTCSTKYEEVENLNRAEVESLTPEDKIMHVFDGSCGISYAERDAINSYQRESYRIINFYLRFGRLDKNSGFDEDRVPFLKGQIRLIEIALKKIAPYEGFLRRRISNFPRMNSVYAEGKTIQEKAFVSTSIVDLKKGGLFNTPSDFGPTRILIKAKNRCHPVWGFSRFTIETEVLCEAGTQFRVILNKKISPKESFIYLEEVDEISVN